MLKKSDKSNMIHSFEIARKVCASWRLLLLENEVIHVVTIHWWYIYDMPTLSWGVVLLHLWPKRSSLYAKVHIRSQSNNCPFLGRSYQQRRKRHNPNQCIYETYWRTPLPTLYIVSPKASEKENPLQPSYPYEKNLQYSRSIPRGLQKLLDEP